MEIVLVFLGIVVLLLGVGVLWMGLPKGPSLASVAHLQVPLILEMEPQKVLLVEARGDPNVVGRKAFGLLMKTYFRLKGVPKGGATFQAPRGRWPVGEGAPKEEWIGLYAMPVPESVSEVPKGATDGDLSVELATWEYGEVAQILHVGRYDAEEPTVEKLMGFLRTQGYVVAGPHEEEYLKGPGMLFAGKPDNYLTIVRYPVRRIHPDRTS